MTHDERVRHHLYETNEGILEHAERIASLEELVQDMWTFFNGRCEDCDSWVQITTTVGTCRDKRPGETCKRILALRDRMRELEVPL